MDKRFCPDDQNNSKFYLEQLRQRSASQHNHPYSSTSYSTQSLSPYSSYTDESSSFGMQPSSCRSKSTLSSNCDMASVSSRESYPFQKRYNIRQQKSRKSRSQHSASTQRLPYVHIDSPIFTAAKLGFPDELRNLGQETNLEMVVDADGNSCLHIAAENGHLACLVVSAERFSNVAVKNANDKAPMDLAQKNQHHECYMYLKQIAQLRSKEKEVSALRSENGIHRKELNDALHKLKNSEARAWDKVKKENSKVLSSINAIVSDTSKVLDELDGKMNLKRSLSIIKDQINNLNFQINHPHDRPNELLTAAELDNIVHSEYQSKSPASAHVGVDSGFSDYAAETRSISETRSIPETRSITDSNWNEPIYL